MLDEIGIVVIETKQFFLMNKHVFVYMASLLCYETLTHVHFHYHFNWKNSSHSQHWTQALKFSTKPRSLSCDSVVVLVLIPSLSCRSVGMAVVQRAAWQAFFLFWCVWQTDDLFMPYMAAEACFLRTRCSTSKKSTIYLFFQLFPMNSHVCQDLRCTD